MKRRLLKLGLLLLLGAIINVAVAWGLAMRVTTQQWQLPFVLGDTGDYERNSFKYWRVETEEAFGSQRVVSGWMDVDIWIGGHQYRETTADLPSWGSFLAPPQHSTPMSMVHMRSAEAWGLPMLSLLASWAGDSPYTDRPTQRLVTGIETSPEKYLGRNLYEARRTLPLMPIWPGFAINTIFYAAIIWLLFFAPFQFRRWRRIRRGLCPACAYPVGTSDKCTECGRPVQAKIEIIHR